MVDSASWLLQDAEHLDSEFCTFLIGFCTLLACQTLCKLVNLNGNPGITAMFAEADCLKIEQFV